MLGWSLFEEGAIIIFSSKMGLTFMTKGIHSITREYVGISPDCLIPMKISLILGVSIFYIFGIFTTPWKSAQHLIKGYFIKANF